MSGNLCLAVASALLAVTVPAPAQEVLTLESVLQRTRERAPSVLAARARTEEARARRIGAAARIREKPAISASAGPRQGPEEFVDVDVGFEQLFEIGGHRAARISAAEALIDRDTATSEIVLREALREVGSAFLDGLAARDRVAVVSGAFDDAMELIRATERRYELGDLSAIDLNLARITAARVRATLAESSAEKISAEGRLRAVLAIPNEIPIVLEGDLAQHGLLDAEGVLARMAELPELRAIAAESREAEAELRLGSAEGRPDVGVSFDFEREEGVDVFRFGGIVELPWTRTGEARRAEAEARGRRLALELSGARNASAVGLRTAYEVYRARRESAEAMTTGALPAVIDNEMLAARSYEAGEIGLLELLLLRREAFDSRVSTIERSLQAALAAIDLELAAGVLR